MHATLPLIGLLLSQVAPTPAPAPVAPQSFVTPPAVRGQIGEPTPAVRPAETARAEQTESTDPPENTPSPPARLPTGGTIRPLNPPSSAAPATGAPATGAPATGAQSTGAPVPTRSPAREDTNGERGAVVQATAEQPLAPVEVGRNSSTTLLLKTALAAPQSGGIEGKSLRLREAIARATSTRQTLKIVKAYWRLSHATCRYHYCLEEAQFLSDLPVSPNSLDALTLQAAIRAQQARAMEMKILVLTEQYAVAEAAQLSADQRTPLAADAPWVGKYRTNFEQLFASRTVPAGLRRINRTLPNFLELIDARAEAVLASTDALLSTAQAYSQTQARLTDVLEAQSRLRLVRREFLMSIRDYNQTIADYAILAVGPGVSQDTIITMLIQPTSRPKSVLVTPKGPGASNGDFNDSITRNAPASVVSPKSGVQPASAVGPPPTPLPPSTGFRDVSPAPFRVQQPAAGIQPAAGVQPASGIQPTGL